jgi:hypothetical protein
MWRQAAVGSVLAALVLLAGNCLRATAADEPARPDQPPKEKARGEEPRKDEARSDQDLQKQIDQLRRELAEMRRQMDQVRPRFPVVPNINPGAPLETPRFPGAFGSRFGAHPRLGVMVDTPNETLADQLNLKKGEGLVVRNVMPESPASKAGLKEHDIIVQVNGKPVANDVGQFAQMIGDLKADSAVDVTVVRKGKEETIKGIKLREGGENPRPDAPRPREPGRRELR